MTKEKIILAYSGGLDTSVAIKWLQEKYNYDVIAVAADVGEGKDLDFVHAIENDERIWYLSNTQTPYSKFLIKQYLEEAHKDVYEAKQLRLVISNETEDALGMIDIFDFDFSQNETFGKLKSIL